MFLVSQIPEIQLPKFNNPTIATKDFVAAKISESKAEIIKWMFIFVFTSTLTTIGAILAIIKFFLKPYLLLLQHLLYRFTYTSIWHLYV